MRSIGFARQQHRSAIGRVGSAQDFDQAGLASAILARECMDLARVQCKVDVVERQYTRKLLGYALYFECNVRGQ